MKRALLALGVAVTVLTGSAAAGDVQSAKATSSRAATAKGKPQRAVGTTGRLTPVQQTLRRDPQLASRISQRLPAKIDVTWASSGFRNLGQFVSAVTASSNLEIPFVTLKARMLDEGMSLGQAIRELRPSADHRKEARRAEQDARTLVRGSASRRR